MGYYVNPGNGKFKISRKSKIYADKSGLIALTNEVFHTRERFVCISRPRRFGKTMAAEMLAAYYGARQDAHALFKDLNISQDPTYLEHLNQYDCLMINVQEFLSKEKKKAKVAFTMSEMIKTMESVIKTELTQLHPDIEHSDLADLIDVMKEIYHTTQRPFVILIDEWDCIFREFKEDKDAQKDYLDFLRLWLKDQEYVGLAYMTGILPIKKYGSHSALNMFDEFSMIDPDQYLDFFGFTSQEVEELAAEYKMDIEEIKNWYNGYFFETGHPIYNPTSVSKCLMRRKYANFWNKTETYEALKIYIKLNFGDLKGKIIRMLTGESIKINSEKFTNDMTTFASADDVLTLLIHLGYLSYDSETKAVRIPNEEVKKEFINAIEDLESWNEVITSIRSSDELLKSVWNQDEVAVASAIQEVHEKNISILQYNDENSLSCVLTLALYTAKDYYTIIREFPSGKGFADLIFIPRKKFLDKPAIVVELKWDKDAVGAIQQIKNKNYVSSLEDYQGNLLMVGINYDKKTKLHECRIENFEI